MEIYQELAFTYSELRMPETAVGYIDKTDDLDCDHVDMLVVRGHILLANMKVEEAQRMFRQAIIDSGSPPRTVMRIIVSLYDNHLLEASYDMFLKYFKMVDDNWNEGYSYMALCCYDLQRYDEFLSYLKKACEVNPAEARIALSHMMPDDMKPEDYYEYMRERLKDKK